MKPLHKIALVCTTFVLAAATGHVMQNAAHDGAALDTPSAAPEIAATPEAAPAQAEPTRLAEAALAPVPAFTPPQMRGPATEPGPGALPQDTAEPRTGFAKPDCAAPQLTGEAVPGGSVLLTVSAPCEAGQKAEIRHEELRLPIQLSAEGGWQGIVPAFAPEALFLLALDRIALPPMVTVTVPEVADYNRIAVIAAPRYGMDLHGYEYGAEPGSIGDVSAAAPRDAGNDLGGWINSYSLPDATTAVQIYSAPAAMTDIRLVLETPVTPQTCGKDLLGAALRMLGKTTDQAFIRLEMPDCGDGEGAVLMQLPDFPLSVAAN